MVTSKRISSGVVWCLLLAGLLLAAAEVEAGRVQKQAEAVGAKKGIVADPAECFMKNCQWLHGEASIRCMIGCRDAYAAAGPVHMGLREDGGKSGIVAGPSQCIRDCQIRYPASAMQFECMRGCGNKPNAAAGSVDLGLREEDGAKNGIVADAAGDCFIKNCQWAKDKFQCMLDCAKENPPAGSVDMGLREDSAKSGIVADAADDCFMKNCLWFHPRDSFQCMLDCGKENPPAESVDMGLRVDGAKSGIVADAAGECFWKNCQWAKDKFQCMLDCAKENPPAGSVDMGLREDGTGAGADGAILQVV